VDTTAKAEDAGPMPFDIESIRMVEHFRIAIGRTEQQDDALPFANGPAPDLHILRGRTAHYLDWCVITQQLVDGASDETGVRAQDVQTARDNVTAPTDHCRSGWWWFRYRQRGAAAA